MYFLFWSTWSGSAEDIFFIGSLPLSLMSNPNLSSNIHRVSQHGKFWNSLKKSFGFFKLVIFKDYLPLLIQRAFYPMSSPRLSLEPYWTNRPLKNHQIFHVFLNTVLLGLLFLHTLNGLSSILIISPTAVLPSLSCWFLHYHWSELDELI